MKLSLLSLSALALSFSEPGAAQEVAGTYSVDRYSVLWEKSVFAAKTGKGELVKFKAENWSLVGVFTFDQGQGAVIVNRKSGSVEQVEQGEANLESDKPFITLKFSKISETIGVQLVRDFQAEEFLASWHASCFR